MQFQVVTNYPIAIESRDHTEPCGTKNDNSRWPAFNKKMYNLEWDGEKRNPLWVMDLGCAGGGFVKDCLDAGHVAIGLEGSDYSLKHKRAEWATIPDNLFTCDVTKPFKVVHGWHNDVENIFYPNTYTNTRFDIITAWEMMEHIEEKDLPGMLNNCLNHLKDDGLMIFSVNTHHQYHHVCIQEKDWWMRLFNNHGLYHRDDIRKYFNRDWIRGPDQYADGSFHVVLGRK